MSEGLQQLLFGALIAAFMAAVYFKPDAPTPFGIPLHEAILLAGDVAVMGGVVWRCLSPPRGRDGWGVAFWLLVLALWQVSILARGAHPRIVMEVGAATVVMTAVGGLYILTRLTLSRFTRGAR